MAEQQLIGTSLWIHQVATTSRSPRSTRPVLMVLAIYQAVGQLEIGMLRLADLSDKAPRDVREALRLLNVLGEIDYRITDDDVLFSVTCGGER